MNPLIFETSVGINSHGPEWEQLAEHMETDENSRTVAGDYSKYDQKIPTQVILATLRIYIDIARELDYSAKDINIMEAMAADIVYSCVAFNGDLIMIIEGLWLSGTSITALIGGGHNGLQMRMAFYKKFPYRIYRMKFSVYVWLTVYGDDNWMKVLKAAWEFNIVWIHEFLGEHGQKFTMPNKSEKLEEFIPEGQMSFLKRKSVYHEALGCRVGALEEKSISKSLHAFIKERKPALTDNAAAAESIKSALTEYFNHGKTVYDERCAQLDTIAVECEIKHFCAKELALTYEDRVVAWKERYNRS